MARCKQNIRHSQGYPGSCCCNHQDPQSRGNRWRYVLIYLKACDGTFVLHKLKKHSLFRKILKKFNHISPWPKVWLLLSDLICPWKLHYRIVKSDTMYLIKTKIKTKKTAQKLCYFAKVISCTVGPLVPTIEKKAKVLNF